MNLKPTHLEDLKASGLTAETIRACGCYSVDSKGASEILDFKLPCGGLVFPFTEGNGEAALLRVKPDEPFQPPSWKKPAKYLSPRKSCNRLYVPPTLDRKALQDPSVPLHFTEGEKKTLAAVQAGFACVGLTGVYSWRAGKDPETGQKHVIPDFEEIAWEGRRAYIVYDSDAATNAQVRAAERELAKELNARGADTLIVRLPALPGVPKVGLDDFLVHRGKEALQELLDEACPSQERPYTLTDDGNASRLIDRHRHDLRYAHDRGWMVWDGHRWILDKTGEARRRAVETVKAISEEAAVEPDRAKASDLFKHAARSLSDAKVKALLSSAQSKLPLPVLVTDFDVDPFLLNVENGTIDLRTGELREHRREDLITKLAPVDFDPSAQEALVFDFLSQIFQDDSDVIGYVKRMVGYSLTADVREHVLFVLHGGGRNGKSTLLGALQTMLGDYGAQISSEALMVRRNENTLNEIAMLRGSRLTWCVESEEGRKLAEGRVKYLTGGDRRLGRFLYHEPFEYDPTDKIVLVTNHPPRITGTDEAIWSRVHLVPFQAYFPAEKQDRTLPQRLNSRESLSTLLSWAVEGCLEWQAEGLQPPDKVVAATKAYRDDMDVIASFLEECCVISEQCQAKSKGLYRAYTEWCEQNGERPLRQRDLGVKLTERGLETTRIGHEGARGWQGIGLLADTADAADTEVSKGESMNLHGDFPENGRSVSAASAGNGRKQDEDLPRWVTET